MSVSPATQCHGFVLRLEMRAEVPADLRAIFDSPDRVEAERRLQLVAERYKGVLLG
jgi:hypothetical protein